MVVTLLITTRGRFTALQRLFESLAQQRCMQFSVLLGDQNSSGYLDDLLEQYRRCFEICHYLIPPQSLSQARNTLLPLVRGDIIAFTDDDCYYSPDALHNLRLFFEANLDVSVLIGNPNAKKGLHSRLENKYSIFKDAPSWVLFFKKNAIQEVGVFDEKIGIGSHGPYQSGEETDYLVRALKAHLRIQRDPTIHIQHPAQNLSDEKCSLKTYQYALGRMYLLKKHAFPLWFKLLNVLYPLALLPIDTVRQGKVAGYYRWIMFKGRLRGLFL